MPMNKTFSTRVEIPAKDRTAIIAVLNQQLADTSDLYSQAKQAHWSLKGPDFIQLHELFDKLAEPLTDAIDDLAERITALGGTAIGTARQVAKVSRLPEYDFAVVEGMKVVETLADRFAHVANTTRKAIDLATDHKDAGTADLFTGLSRSLDKSLWFLEAHLQ
jgi:starvation-inducible DNA-binding protein